MPQQVTCINQITITILLGCLLHHAGLVAHDNLAEIALGRPTIIVATDTLSLEALYLVQIMMATTEGSHLLFRLRIEVMNGLCIVAG